MAGLQPILNKYTPGLRGIIRVEDILSQVHFPSSGTVEITRFRNSDKNEDIDILIEVIGRIDDNNNTGNDLSCSVIFLKYLQKSKVSGIRLIAEQIISEAENVFPNIREHFLPPSLTKSGTNQPETSPSYLTGDIANVRPSTLVPRSSTHADIAGIPSPHGNLKFLTAIKGHSPSQNSRHTVPQQDICRFCADTKIEDIPNALFLQLVKELKEDKHWEKIGNKMGLTRKEMREVEKSEDPAKMLLDHVGDTRLRELFNTFQAAGISEILHELSISLIEEPTDTKIEDIPNELFLQLVKELNEDKHWEKIGNKIGLTGKEMREFEKRSNPAKDFLYDHRYLTIEKLCILMQGLHFDPATENQIILQQADSLPQQRFSENNVHEEIRTQDGNLFPPNTTESISESTTDNTNSNTLTPLIDPSSLTSTGRLSVCLNAAEESSSRENSLTHLKIVQERMESLAQNGDMLPLTVPSNLDLDNGRGSQKNAETTPVSDNLDNRQHMSQVSVIVTSDKNIVTCPENETQSEKNPEMAATALLDDAYDQYRADEYRDIQNSVPYTSENHCSRVANHVNVAVLSSTKKDTTHTTIPATNISSPTDTNDSEKKNLEQECAALINDAAAQIVGTGYRDLQNSLPDSLSSDEMEEN